MRPLRPLLLLATALTLSCQDPQPVATPRGQAQAAGVDTADTAPAPPPAALPDGPVRVIVGVDVPFTPAGDLDAPARLAQRAAATSAVDALVSRLGSHAKVNRRYRTIPFVALSVDAAGLAQLRTDPAVSSVDKDDLATPLLADTTVLIGAPYAWDLGSTGAGQTIAILDTGVASEHPFLAGKVVGEACFGTTDISQAMESFCPGGVETSTAAGSGAPCPSYVNGCDHGTHVAGIAAGNTTGRKGVAPDAEILAIQVFSELTSFLVCGLDTVCPRSSQSDYVAALEHVLTVVEGGRPVASVNMSLGGGLSALSCDGTAPSTKAAIDNLISVGTATVVAAGNDGSGAGVSEPGCISTAVTVGATNKADDIDTSYSNSGSALDLLAPGTDVVSATGGASYVPYSGTSMAAPHVAGAWAVMKSRTFDATVDDVLDAFVISGVPKTDPRNNVTRPRIRLDAAVEALEPAFAPTYSPPGGDYVEAQTVTIRSESPEANLRYTLDGTTPTKTDGVLATSGNTFLVDRDLTVYGVAYTEARTSIVSSARYVIRPKAPTLDPPDSEWAEPVTVTIGSDTPQTAVRYTLDGSTPTESHGTVAPVGHTVELSSTTTVKVIATRDGWSPSAVTSARYVVRGTLAVDIEPPGAVTSGARWRRGDASVESFEDGNLGRFASTRSGAGSWSLRQDESPYGQWSLRSPSIAAGTTASYAVTVECDGGRVRFARRVNTADSADQLVFTIDGQPTASWRGDLPWEQVSYPVTAGTHTFTWTWERDAASGTGNTASIDQITFPGDQWRQSGTQVPVYESTQHVLFSVVPAWDTPAIATVSVSPGATRSVVGTYARFPAEPPSFSPTPGTYGGSRSVTMSTSTPSATIRYTTDGSTPTASSTVYTTPLVLAPGTTTEVRAYTSAPERTDSPVSTGTWVITGSVEPVELDPAPGAFDTAPAVTMTSATAGAVIHYTLDGSAPTESSPTWTTPVTLPSGDTTVRARAWRSGLVESAETRGDYAVYPTATLALAGLTDGLAVPGSKLTLTVDGGVGPFSVRTAPRADEVALDIDPLTDRSWEVQTRAVGGFAGTWELLVTDEARSLDASIVFSQPLRVSVDRTQVRAGETVEVTVGGAARDDTVSLVLIDDDGAPVSAAVATLPATAVANGRTSDGNGAYAPLVAGISDRDEVSVRVKASWDGLEAISEPIVLLAPVPPPNVGKVCGCDQGRPTLGWLVGLGSIALLRRRRAVGP